MANTSGSKSSPSGASRNERGAQESLSASSGAAGSSSSSGGGLGLRSGKGGGAAQPQSHAAPGVTRPDRPTRSTGENRTGTNPGFTEDETKDVAVSSGGGLATSPERLSEEDPDHGLRGEDQLVDGDSEVVDPGSLEEE